MQATIIYFTGTGNSLAVAWRLAKRLFDATILSVSEMLQRPVCTLDTNICGFVFPVYFQNMPEIVHRLARKIEFHSSTYIFAVATHNGDPGYSHFTLNRALKKRGQHLRAGFAVLMPGNCITPSDSTNSDDVTQHRINAMDACVDKIANSIMDHEILPYEGSNSLRKKLKNIKGKYVFNFVHKVPQAFWSTESCNQCGLCTRICPENNINIDSGTPVWGNRCQICLACIHWCPQQAIQNGDGTIERKRYHHPDISLNDMILRP